MQAVAIRGVENLQFEAIHQGGRGIEKEKQTKAIKKTKKKKKKKSSTKWKKKPTAPGVPKRVSKNKMTKEIAPFQEIFCLAL